MSDDRHNTGRVIVALPADDEPIHAFGEEDKHLTLLWLGTPEENPDLDMEAVKEAVAAYAAETPPFIALIDKTGELGDEGARVSFLAPDDVPHYEQLLQNPVLAEAVGKVEQFPEFLPHVTLGYDMAEEDAPNPTGTILFDRIAVWNGDDRSEYPFQRVTSLPVTDVFTLQRAVALADKLPVGSVRDAARRTLSRRAKELACKHVIPTQWLRDRAASAAFRAAVVEKYKGAAIDSRATANIRAAATFAAKAFSSGLPDDILRTVYMRAVREYSMTPASSRPPLTRDQVAQARVNSLIRLAQGDLSARSDDSDLLSRVKEA
jgi:2'-5' RNA ligase